MHIYKKDHTERTVGQQMFASHLTLYACYQEDDNLIFISF